MTRREAMTRLEIAVKTGAIYPKHEIGQCHKAGVTYRQVAKIIAGLKIHGQGWRTV